MRLKPSQAKLISKAVEIQKRSALERDEMGFSTRMFVQCSLPHRDPAKKGNPQVWKRINGTFSLRIQPGWDEKDGKWFCIGYPYGNIPRLLLLYICTQVIQTGSKEISLGTSLSDFLRSIDLEVTGGRWGTITRVKDQMWRLFSASIFFNYEDDDLQASKKANIASSIQLWWNRKRPEQTSLFESYICLTEEFYNEVMNHPIPIDMGIVSAIKQSPLAIDLYTWLTYRTSYLNKPISISWMSLAEQMGSEYTDVKDFAKRAKEALGKIYGCWPDLRVNEQVRGGLILKPSRPSVPKKLFPATLKAKT